MIRKVPLEEARQMREFMAANRKPWLDGSPLLRLVEFAEQFATREFPDMVVAPSMAEVVITEPTLDAEQIDLVRLNCRVFVPEILAIEPQLDEDDLTDIITNSLGPDWTPQQAAKALFAELYGKEE